MANVRVSVVMASYNGEKYIKEQIVSIMDNLDQDDELIISDDNSKDRTRCIVNSLAVADSRIHLVDGPCKGLKANFSNAITMCKGKYIFLCDQDDIWFDNKVSKVLPLLQEHDLVVHDCIVTGSNIQDILIPSFFEYRNSGPGIFKNITKNTYIGCCMAFTKKLAKEMFPIPENIEMHDQWIGILNDIYFKNTYFLHEPLMYYRRHGENVSSMKHFPLLKMIRNRLTLCSELIRKVI